MPVADVLDDPAFARLDGISAIVTRCSRSRGDFRDVSSGNDVIQRARQVHDASFVTGAIGSLFVLASRSWELDEPLTVLMFIQWADDADGAAKTDNQHFLETANFHRREIPSGHRFRALDDFENKLLDDQMVINPARSDHDFFTRFFNRFFGNLGNQQQCQSVTLPLRSERQRQNATASLRTIFSKPRVRDRTDNNAIAGYVALR